MMSLEIIQNNFILQVAGWALLHFIWQGALIALFTVAVLALLRNHSANMRCAAASAALLLMFVAPLFTAWRTVSAVAAAEPLGAVSEEQLPRRAAPVANEQFTPASRFSHSPAKQISSNKAAADLPFATRLLRRLGTQGMAIVPWLAVVWLSCALVLLARIGGGLFIAGRLKRTERRPLAPQWRAACDTLARRLRISRRVGGAQSARVKVPTTIGWLRPVVLVPESTLANLSAPQMEAVLVHELAHVRRHDYLLNILQSLIEAALFYHPAVWWVSKQIRLEREHACDDCAVALTGSVITYARALTEIETLCRRAGAWHSRLALGAGGGSLLARIQRLACAAASSPKQRRSFGVLAATLAIFAVGTVLISARGIIDGQRLELTMLSRTPPAPPRIVDTAANDQQLAPTTTNNDLANLIAGDDTRGEDAEVRRAAVAALGQHVGSVVVMDPRDGRVYAVVNQEWALRRGWAPASTFKLITSLAGLSEKLFNPTQKVRVTSQGKVKLLDLTDAMAISDTPYFEIIGERVGAERLLNYAKQFGLGETTGANYTGEIPGKLPRIDAELNLSRLGGAGGGVEITPMQLGVLISALANGGTRLVPHTVRTPEESSDLQTATRKSVEVSPEALRQLVPGLIKAVTDGTAQGAGNVGVRVAGKTGTSMNRETGLGLFASYAPVDNPRLVVVVLTHGPKENGVIAAEVAGDVYRALAKRLKAD